MGDKMSGLSGEIKSFCLIQLQILKDREERLRKELLACKIQTEYLTSIISSPELQKDSLLKLTPDKESKKFNGDK